jgi:hypothetical protein
VNASPGATGEPQPQWHRCEAFGLTIESDWPLPGSSLVPAGARSAAPVTRVIRVEPTVFDDAWAAEAERLLEYRPPDQPGSGVTFTADRSSAQYRFWAEDFGRYLVSVDGGMVACERGSVGREQNERFVFAHALPVAAILRGYEALHVSAVSGEAGAAAFAGASGTGKTRLASRLVARGAAFLTDDVLAVEAAGDDVLAHPGPAFMAIRPDDAAMIAEVGGRLGAAVGSSDKTHVSLPGRGAASPLRAIYHLHWGDAFQITPLQRGDLNRVLALSFVPYLTTPERLMRHLTIAQLVSAGVAQFRLQTPQSELGEEMLAALEAHMRDAGV